MTEDILAHKLQLLLSAIKNNFNKTDDDLCIVSDYNESNHSFVIPFIMHSTYVLNIAFSNECIASYISYGTKHISLNCEAMTLDDIDSLLKKVNRELLLRLGDKFVSETFKFKSREIDKPESFIEWGKQLGKSIVNVLRNNVYTINCRSAEPPGYCRDFDFTISFNLHDTFPILLMGTTYGIDGYIHNTVFGEDIGVPFCSYVSLDAQGSFDFDDFSRLLKEQIESRLPDKFLRQRLANNIPTALSPDVQSDKAPSGLDDFRHSAEEFFGARFHDGEIYTGDSCFGLLHPKNDYFLVTADGENWAPPVSCEKSAANEGDYAVMFSAYATYFVILARQEGMLNAYLYFGKPIVPLNPRKLPMPETRMHDFFQLVKEELELRLPDEFLAKYGWLE